MWNIFFEFAYYTQKTATTSVAATEFRLLKRIGMLFIVAEDRVNFRKCNKGI